MIYFELDYEAEEAKKVKYLIESDSRFVVTGPPTVTWVKYIRLMSGDEQIGKLDATFDFSDVPPQLHTLVLHALSRGAMYLHVNL